MYYFITLLFILLSAKGTFIFFANIFWLIIDLVFIWVGLEKNRFDKKDVKLFFNFFFLYAGFCTFRWLFLIDLPARFWISDMVFFFKFIFTSFLYCAVLKDKALYYLTRVIIHLAIISIPFYFLQLVAGDVILAIGKFINLPPRLTYQEYVNFIIFTYVPGHAIRNSGFSWEPGAYGFFLNTCLVLYFLTNKFTFDKKAALLVLAIITTLSTTSYAGLLVVLLLYFRANRVSYVKLLVLLVPVLLVVIVQIPFLFTKVSLIYTGDVEDMKNIQFLSKYYIERGEQMPLNRFGSMLYVYQLFGNNIFFGVSNMYNQSYPILQNINISNGISDFCAKFGIIGLGFLFQRSYLLFKKFTNSTELSIYCMLVILVLGFGECIFILSLTLCFFFLYYYYPQQEGKFALATNDEPDRKAAINMA